MNDLTSKILSDIASKPIDDITVFECIIDALVDKKMCNMRLKGRYDTRRAYMTSLLEIMRNFNKAVDIYRKDI